MSGAAMHSSYMSRGCIASINIGLQGKAVKGQNWRTHRATLLEIFVKALTFVVGTIGMLVSEVGSVTDPYDEGGNEQFSGLFNEAVHAATQHTGDA